MKKYAHLHPPLADRIVAEEKNKSNPDKAAKTKLHQLYGAYLQPNAHKKVENILSEANEKEAIPKNFLFAADGILRLHASTRERLPHYPDFYAFILNHIDPPASLMDLGCGFNPFSLPYLLDRLPPNHLQIYRAYDIDTRQAESINRFFSLYGLPTAAECLDLAVEIPAPKADLALMLKLLPVLEAQSPANGFRLARSLNVKHLVISYPLKSLGGKEKGMARHYRHTFEAAYNAGELSPFVLRAESQIGTEWVCILKRINASPPSPIST
jgi:16S rRNA (guanine(1405)-N(7))-methyltransferase